MAGPAWLGKAHEEMGVEEVAGAESNPRIMEYFAAAPGSEWVKDDGTPWCGGFMAWLMEPYGALPSEPLRARAWLGWGETLKEPVPGCVVVLKRGSDPKSGHVALFQQWSKDKSSMYLLGGNQGNRVSIARFKTADVLGYRWPAGEKVATGADLANGSTLAKVGKGLAGTGAVTATGGAIIPQIPAPPVETMGQLTAWQSFLAQATDFLQFVGAHWMICGGVLAVVAGAYVYQRRLSDAKEGKTWVF
jgi:uncharacterized protein (TIGR02594 family)